MRSFLAWVRLSGKTRKYWAGKGGKGGRWCFCQNAFGIGAVSSEAKLPLPPLPRLPRRSNRGSVQLSALTSLLFNPYHLYQEIEYEEGL